MKQEVKKLLILNLPYLLFVYLFDKIGQQYALPPARTQAKNSCSLVQALPLPFQYRAEPAPRRFAYRHCGGGHYPACRLHERQKREEIPKRHGIRLRALECIILSVKNSTWTHRRICT